MLGQREQLVCLNLEEIKLTLIIEIHREERALLYDLEWWGAKVTYVLSQCQWKNILAVGSINGVKKIFAFQKLERLHGIGQQVLISRWSSVHFLP